MKFFLQAAPVKDLEHETFQYRNKKQKPNPDFLLIHLFVNQTLH